MNMKKKILVAILSIIVAIITGFGFYSSNINNTEENIVENVVDTIVDELEKTKEEIQTTEIPEVTTVDEEALEYQETEAEGFQLQGEIAYNGSKELPKIDVGKQIGLTYYSQIDNRWKNDLYTSTNNKTQTIGSSGCGPTTAAMVVTSIKGVIQPDTLSDLFVKYGYRSTDNGTYWSAFRWTADVFDIGYTEKYKLNDICDLLEKNHIMITACGNGLFTTGGHFIVIYGYEDINKNNQCDNGDNLKIYDPYLYSGKFSTSTRRGKAKVTGNTVLVEKETFRAYANYGTFFCYKNDSKVTNVNDNNTLNTIKDGSKTFKKYSVTVTTKIGLNVRQRSRHKI